MEKDPVLITGASEGLGREFARIFAENGYRDVVNHDYWCGAVAQQVAFVDKQGAFA
jgi:NAD(P)-dependent dehydrogenase (short-subunit alcohol dehydrogenase family)